MIRQPVSWPRVSMNAQCSSPPMYMTPNSAPGVEAVGRAPAEEYWASLQSIDPKPCLIDRGDQWFSAIQVARRLGMWSRRSWRHAAPCSP
jgi:hypothetical protein